jgi:tetratricopeptide (TPR) repeat protein
MDQRFIPEAEGINFGALPPEIDELLQEGVRAYRRDRAAADRLFRQALSKQPSELAPYYCLYKIHTYMGSLDTAAEIATEGLKEATRQAGWSEDPRLWPDGNSGADGPGRFALYTLKALSFIELRRDNKEKAMEYLDILAKKDPRGSVGWTVIVALAEGLV